MASKAVLAARARRLANAGKNKEKLDIFVKDIQTKINLPIEQRVKVATEYLRSTVAKNISKSVGRGVDGNGHSVVIERSKKGEYPRADTTQLLKTLFGEVIEDPPGTFTGYVGTPLDYGFILETSLTLDRRFLLRAFLEELVPIMAILTGPLKP